MGFKQAKKFLGPNFFFDRALTFFNLCAQTAFGNLRSLKARGHLEFDFLNPEHFKEKRKGSQNKRDTTRLFVIIILVFFTVVLVVSFVHIVCISKSPSTACVNALTPSSL